MLILFCFLVFEKEGESIIIISFILNYKIISINSYLLKKVVNHIKFIKYLYYHFKIIFYLSFYSLICFLLIFKEKIIKLEYIKNS